jgi:hypothetical protein
VNERDLQRALTDLAPAVGFPETPDLAGRVAAIVAQPAPARRRLRLLPALATAAVVLLAAFLVASPGAREAIADWLGIGGVRVTTQDDPAPTERLPGETLGLGEPLSTLEARERVDIALRFLAPDELGQPDATYFAEAVGFEQVTFVYEPQDGLPAAPGRQEALLFTQFRGEPAVQYFKKMSQHSPVADGVTVDGVPGLWLEGAHELQYVGPDGTLRSESTRLSASTLLWAEDGITYRLESDLSKSRSLELANALE